VDFMVTTCNCLLAQADGAPPNIWQGLQLPLMVLMVFAMYIFIVQQPKAKREQQMRQQMLKNLKKNDHVLTTGGIYGVVTNVQLDADEVTIRVDDASNARLRMTLSSVARVLGDDSAGDKEPKKELK
jgi:preprotein translocase subunit YajC